MATPYPGMDDDYLKQLQALIATIQPSAEDKAQSKWQGLLSMGLGMMGAKKGGEFQQFGQAGLLGMKTYNDELARLTQQRGANLTQAGGLYKLAKDAQMQDWGRSLLNDGGPPQMAPTIAPTAGGSPQSAPMQPMGATPVMQQAQPVMQSAQPTTQSQFPSWRSNVPKEQLAAAVMSGDYKKVADVIGAGSKLEVGREGTLLMGGTLVGRMLPNGGAVLYQNGDIAKPQFFADPKEAQAAAADWAGATEGAKKAAQTKYEITKVPIGNSTMDLPSDVAQMILGSGLPDAQKRSVAELPREQIPAAITALQASNSGMGVRAPVGGKATIIPGAVEPQLAPPMTKSADRFGQTGDTVQNAQDTEVAKAYGQDYVNAITGERVAAPNIAKYTKIKSMYGNIETGKLAPTVQSLKAIAASVAPDLAKSWTADVPYAQAAAALSNQMALELRNPAGGAGMPGSLSDSDRQFLTSMIANVSNDPRSIPMILDAKIAIEKRNQDIGKLARQYKRKTGVIDEGFYQELSDYSESHPLFKEFAAPATTGGGWSYIGPKK